LMRQLRREKQIAFLDQLQPIGNIVVDRTFPLAIWIAAIETPASLAGGVRRIVTPVNFLVVFNANLD